MTSPTSSGGSKNKASSRSSRAALDDTKSPPRSDSHPRGLPASDVDNPSTIVVIGTTHLDKDQDEAVRDLGRAIAHVGKTLITTKAPGVASAVAAGYQLSGKKATYLKAGTAPETENVVVLGNNDFLTKLEDRLPDYRDRGWLIIHINDLFDFHLKLLQVLSEQNRPLPAI